MAIRDTQPRRSFAGCPGGVGRDDGDAVLRNDTGRAASARSVRRWLSGPTSPRFVHAAPATVAWHCPSRHRGISRSPRRPGCRVPTSAPGTGVASTHGCARRAGWAAPSSGASARDSWSRHVVQGAPSAARRAGGAARWTGRARSCGASRSCATPLRSLAECTLSCALRQEPFVTQSQPAAAVGDAATVIPAHLTRRAHWTRRGIRGGAARPFGRGRVGEVEWVSRVGEVERVRSVSRSGRLPGDRAGRVDHALAGEGVARLRARAGARPAGARHVARLP